MPPLEIRVLPLENLQRADYNPRRPLTKKAAAKLRASLKEFGLVEPLVWNEATNRLVGGHARLAILQELGYTEVPVSVVRLSEAKERALNVVLNNQEAQGRYDPVRLLKVLEDLAEADELDLSGFDYADLRSLALEPLEDPVPTPDTTEGVEIILRTTAETYTQLAEPLDALIRQFDLESHVRETRT
jgi:ParB-like chromosome segregation protein Spo0J